MENERENNFMLLFVIGLVVWLLILIAAPAHAGKPKPPVTNQEQGQSQHQGQGQAQGQKQTSKASSDAYSNSLAISDSSATNEGNSLSVNTVNESGPADLVLVPNNNTESCLRVFGLAWGNKDASGMLGIPWRSGKCDYEQAADDAFAAGERETGWFWKCQNKNLYKRFRDKGESRQKASQDCFDKMVGPITVRRQLQAAEDQLAFIENERRIERENNVIERNRIQEDCSESNKRVLEACVSK